MITADQLASILCFDSKGKALKTPSPASVSAAWAAIIAAAPEVTRLGQIALAATVAVECPSWIPQREKRAKMLTQPRIYLLQNRYWSTGYMGRGFVQLTWRGNYEACGMALGLDLLKNPDLLLDLKVSARALIWFFQKNGIFEAAEKRDWKLVRKLVNGGNESWVRFYEVVTTLENMPLNAIISDT